MELSQLVIPWGQSAKLTCEVRGNPPPSVLWLRNAVPIASSQRLRLSRRALRVVSVGPEDEGVYQCMAENEVGSAHAVVQLRTARPGECSPKAWRPQRHVHRALSSTEIQLKTPIYKRDINGF